MKGITHAKQLKGRNVLVTGAAGCIGAWTVKLLKEIGANPVVYDLTENRARLHLIMDDAEAVTWEIGDITDFNHLKTIVQTHDITAIIHLAALQVPFCKADPVGSTKVNVMGSINILEVARAAGIKRLCYASSVAAPAMGENDYLATLYGAHKICGEQMAAVYWQDWQVPSIGIRPGIIYGPARDQGMSAAPTIAMLAALENKAYTIPFTGPVSFVHVEDAAKRFIAAVSQIGTGAPIFDMNGTPETVDTVLRIIHDKTHVNAKVSCSGLPLPFPAHSDDGRLDALIGVSPFRSMQDGIEHSLEHFKSAKARGFDITALATRLTEPL